MKQSEAVVFAAKQAFEKHGVDFVPGTTDARTITTSAIRKDIVDGVVNLFESGQVEFKQTESNQSKLNDVKLLRAYVGGLVTNWFNKSKELNGGQTYKVSSKKQPDAQLKELHLLRKEAQGHVIDPENLALIEQAIAEREAEINA